MRFAFVLAPGLWLLTAQQVFAQDIVLVPQQLLEDETVTQPTIDGDIDPLEYADGKKLVLQNFQSQPGMPNSDGKGYLVVSDTGTNEPGWRSQTMFLGIEVPLITGIPALIAGPPTNGALEIFIDSQRNLSPLPANTMPRTDDRRLLITFPLSSVSSAAASANPTPAPVAVTVQQFRGTGNASAPWVDITGTVSAWTAYVAAAHHGGGRMMYELRLELTVEIVSTSKKFGLGVRHVGTQAAWLHQVPNQAAPIANNNVNTWATVRLERYTPIPLSLTTYNVGQMPLIWFCPLVWGTGACETTAGFLEDGGEGEAGHFADELYNKEISCLQEIWSRGDREELIEEISSRREQDNLSQIHAAGMPPNDNPDDDGAGLVHFFGPPLQICLWVPVGVGFACIDQEVEAYTGLLVLSERAHLASELLEFPEDQCYGTWDLTLDPEAFDHEFDCAQDKGMIWARVLTSSSDPQAPGPIAPVAGIALETAVDTSQFIDVFCTHLDAGGDQEDVDARQANLATVKSWIDERRANDRPAILAGDLNIHGNPEAEHYASMLDILDIDQLTVFDQVNSTFSDIYDIKAFDLMDRRLGSSVGDCGPLSQSELHLRNLYDYVLLLPPPSSATSFPNFAVLKDPISSLHTNWEASLDGCLSDHAMLQANIELVQTYEPGKWNGSRPHVVKHSMQGVYDYEEGSESDSDWFSSDHWIHRGASAGAWSNSCNNPHGSDDPNDGSNTSLYWESCTMSFVGADIGGASFELDDEEGAGTYDYDTSPFDNGGGNKQRNAHFIFDHLFGRWQHGTDGWTAIQSWNHYDSLQNIPGEPFRMSFDLEGDGDIGTEETDYRARTLHTLTAIEE